jgi:hypothetical protein
VSGGVGIHIESLTVRSCTAVEVMGVIAEVSMVLLAALLLIGKAADNRHAPAIKPVVSFLNITIRYK